MNEALGCVTPGRMTVSGLGKAEVEGTYGLVLNRGDPVRLKAESPISLSVGRTVRIASINGSRRGPFEVQTVAYWYQYATTDNREILAFHWTPETHRLGERRYPHLHVGSVILADRTPILPGRFNKAHIPTGPVSLAAVIRFGIEELGVRPIRAEWASVLERLEGGSSDSAAT